MLESRLSPFEEFKHLVRTGRLEFTTVRLMAKLGHEFALTMYPCERMNWSNGDERYTFFLTLMPFYRMDYALFMAKAVVESIVDRGERENANLCIRQCEYITDPSKAYLAFQLGYATNRCVYDAKMRGDVHEDIGTEALLIVSCCGRTFSHLGDSEEMANALDMMCERGNSYFPELSYQYQQTKLLALILEQKDESKTE